MPIHDWTRVDDSVCLSFHLDWCVRLKQRLNDQLLPPDLYALLEPIYPVPVDGFNGPTIGERLLNAEVEEPIILDPRAARITNALGWNAVVIRTADGDTVVDTIHLPLRVGGTLPDMPVFLRPGACVMLPLEETYTATYQAMPPRWRRVIEADPPAE